MAITIVSWNVNRFTHRDQVAFLDGLSWDVALLQEVTRDTWPEFLALGTSGGVAFDHLPPLIGDGPMYASAIVARGPAHLHGFSVVPQVPSPELAISASIDLDGTRARVCSWATPPASSWGRAGRSRQVLRYAAWLAERTDPVVVGIDRNGPRFERFDLEDDEWWNEDEPALYGPDRAHDLRDVYRDLVDADPDLRREIAAARPEGPLAVTYRRPRGDDCRYDAVYASPEFVVESVDHLWEESREADSDHAAIVVSLRWDRDPPA